MIEKLVNKFKANSIRHLFIIFVIFALSGSGSLFISSPILIALGLEKLITFTSWIKEKIQNFKDDANAASNDYLKVLGLVAVGYSWYKVLQVSFDDYENNKNFYEDKIQTANFFFKRVIPRIDSHCSSAMSGSKYIMDYKFN